jgi:hypothetical protein
MNKRNIQIEAAKAIRLPQDGGHMLRLILETFLMEEIEDSSNHKNENRAKNSSKNQENKKYINIR